MSFTPDHQRPFANVVKLQVLLCLELFTERAQVSRIVAETRAGRFELLPGRLDCIAALAPGILRYETTLEGPGCLALDEGVLIKAGGLVLVSVRRTLGRLDLARLPRTST